MTADFLLQLVIGLAGAAGVYAAIKADLARAIIMAEHAAQEAVRASDRITEHIDNHRFLVKE